MVKLLYVGLGGFLGSTLRYVAAGAVYRLFPSSEFPLGTLIVNVSGSFVLGLLAAMADARGIFSEELRAFMFIGILGAYTTFSTFAYESIYFYQQISPLKAIVNIVASVVLCLLAAWAGAAVSRSV